MMELKSALPEPFQGEVLGIGKISLDPEPDVKFIKTVLKDCSVEWKLKGASKAPGVYWVVPLSMFSSLIMNRDDVIAFTKYKGDVYRYLKA